MKCTAAATPRTDGAATVKDFIETRTATMTTAVIVTVVIVIVNAVETEMAAIDGTTAEEGLETLFDGMTAIAALVGAAAATEALIVTTVGAVTEGYGIIYCLLYL